MGMLWHGLNGRSGAPFPRVAPGRTPPCGRWRCSSPCSPVACYRIHQRMTARTIDIRAAKATPRTASMCSRSGLFLLSLSGEERNGNGMERPALGAPCSPKLNAAKRSAFRSRGGRSWCACTCLFPCGEVQGHYLKVRAGCRPHLARRLLGRLKRRERQWMAAGTQSRRLIGGSKGSRPRATNSIP